MQLKNSYSSREVAALTGLSARQLQWWDDRRLFLSAVGPKPTAAGGFTERRYTPVDLLELMVLADLAAAGHDRVARFACCSRRSGRGSASGSSTRSAVSGSVTLLTDGRDVYARTAKGQFYNLLRDPEQPLLVIGPEPEWRELASKAHAVRGRKKKKGGAKKRHRSFRRGGTAVGSSGN